MENTGFSGCKTGKVTMSTVTILQAKKPTTNVCPIEPENLRLQKNHYGPHRT